nr:hypothetical protein [Clostridium pasteurianum]
MLGSGIDIVASRSVD